MTDRPEIHLGLKDRVVLVTGGVRGVGAGISSVFAAQGATVATCARRPVDGSPYEFHSCDVRDDESVAALIETVAGRHGRLDVVVNNAGGSPYVLAADSSAKFNTKIVELNLLGPLGFDTRERGDADAAAGWLDHQRRQRQRPSAHTRHRTIRCGQGGHGEHHRHPGGRVGP